MKIHGIYRNNDEYSYPFCSNIGAKYHVILHRVLGRSLGQLYDSIIIVLHCLRGTLGIELQRYFVISVGYLY